MIRTIKICDGCKLEDKKNKILVYSYKINMGHYMDPSGNGYNINWRYVDYCSKCYVKALVEFGKNIKVV